MLGDTFRSLGRRNYRVWVWGALFSNIGTWMQFTTQDWLVLTELTHHDAMAIGIVMALQLAPPLLLMLWTGLIADRVEKHRFLLFTQGALGVLAVALGLLVVTGSVRLWQVDLFAFLSGCVAAFDSPVRQTFVGELVGETDLPNAVAINSMSYNAGRMIGPAVAGFCIAEIGSGWSFVLNGFSFFGVMGSLLFIRREDLFRHAKARETERNALTSGLRYVWAREDLRTILIMLFIIGAFGLNFPIFIATMAVGVFHVGAHGYGILNSAMAVGTILGGFLAAGRKKADFDVLLNGSLIFGVGCLLGALAPTYWLFACTLLITGVSSLTFTATSNSFMQLSSDPSMRGRVLAIRFAVFAGSSPFGAPVVGWVANYFGPRWSLGVGALSGFLAAVVALLYILRMREQQGEEHS
ncbi:MULTISPECIES: MFS transporter [Gluconobacter]|uniref:MFS transporter n=1 Tax=Gluconobacter TaxID=441 RepID=UPI000B668E04|nr:MULTISPECIES: MFS transporter [Gluconobacter]MBS1023936.1 MFS transporter [Gluconobacter cerinus]MBS1036385.1 MFS transporter [Gluconobacter cerinus]MBS1044613.1 MFS transporter [Gluconobacter cerinus]OUJ08516.1 MFS transporter [Gluconobacter sp. DsW_058]